MTTDPLPPRRRSRDPALAGALARRARARREAMLLAQFPDIADMDVLDLGGTRAWWLAAGVRPRTLTILNLIGGRRVDETITMVRGDACDPPKRVTAQSYDLVFSNSLIEHVGGHERRQQLAAVVDRLAPHHWVQTPNKWFPVEPHWVFPGMQFLPEPLQVVIAHRWPLGHNQQGRTDRSAALAAVRDVELIGPAELQAYFPGSTILRETFAGVAKSIIAVR